jgi:predicted nucleotidyltransferase
MTLQSACIEHKLVSYASSLTEIFGDTLFGAYVYGSFARGCYNAVTSDIDFLMILKRTPTDQEVRTILRVPIDLGLVLDAVFVTSDQIKLDVFPTPVQFLIKPNQEQAIYQPDGSKEFLLHRQDAYEAGITLVGSPAHECIPPVPWPLITQCLGYLSPYIISHFKNPALMLCRIAYAHTQHKLCSKQEAGKWALSMFDPNWKPIMEKALADYAAGIPNTTHRETLTAFESYCTDYIKETLGQH